MTRSGMNHQRYADLDYLSLGRISWLILGVLLVVLFSFVQWHFPVEVKAYKLPEHYVATIPIMLTLAAYLGAWLGLWISVSYLILGLCLWPLFANGGGLDYWQEPGFSYLLSLPLGAWTCGHFYRRARFARQWWQSLLLSGIAAVCSVLIVHLVGAVGLCIQSTVGLMSITALSGWLHILSLHSLMMDTLLTMCLLLVIRPLPF